MRIAFKRTARAVLAGSLMISGAMTATMFAAAPLGATPVPGTAASAQGHVNWALAGRPRGIVYKHGVQPRSGAQARSGQSATSGLTSTNPECQAFGFTPACDPPLLFTANDPVMGNLSSSPGHVTLTPVYWAPAGYSFPASYKSIINTYFADVAAASGTTGNVFSVATEYYQQLGTNPNQYIQYSVQAGAEVDVSAAFPAQNTDPGCVIATGSGNTACVTDGALQTQLQATLQADSLPVDDSHLYVVLFPPNVETCEQSGGADFGSACSTNVYCGYHSAFQDASAANAPAIYANMPYVQPTSCGDPRNGAQAPNGNSYADTEISILSHEANESITDWGNAWLDANGYEIGDECAYVYGVPLGSTGVATDGAASGTRYNQVINGHEYYTQDEFSNAAYAANVGDVNTPTGPDFAPFVLNVTVAGCLQRGFSISTAILPPATPGAAYGPVTLHAAPAGVSTAPYTTTLKWKKLFLPKGLKLSSAGVLSGTPNSKLTAGQTAIVVQATETVITLNGTKKVKTKTPVQRTIPLSLIGPGANLAGAQLPQANLSSANLSHTILASANLNGANLSNALATQAVFDGADLTSANLTGAQATQAVFAAAHLDADNFTNAELTGANFAEANVFYANLTGANLTGASLTVANFTGANFTNANLTGVNFLAANLTGATFTSANLSGVLWLSTTCPDGSNSASYFPQTCIGHGI